MQERDKSHQHTRREVACDSDNTRDFEDQPAVPNEPRDHAVAHVCQHMNLRVVPRSGIGEFRNGEAVNDIEQRDLPSVTEKRETSSTIEAHVAACETLST